MRGIIKKFCGVQWCVKHAVNAPVQFLTSKRFLTWGWPPRRELSPFAVHSRKRDPKSPAVFSDATGRARNGLPPQNKRRPTPGDSGRHGPGFGFVRLSHVTITPESPVAVPFNFSGPLLG